MDSKPWQASVLTLYPEMFPGPLGAGVIGRGRAEGRWSLETINIRAFSDNRYGSVDDTPAGGGAGLIMRADILAAAIDSVEPMARPVLYPSPRGAPLTQTRMAALARDPGAIILCGRFEGIDDRLIAARGIEEVCLGDIVLAGGEIAAMAIIEACVRLIPGVLGSAQSLGVESFGQAGLLEYPQYTRPRDFEGVEIPAVLQSGDHGRIDAWRREMAEQTTRTRRPDLWARYLAQKEPENGPLRRGKSKKDQGS